MTNELSTILKRSVSWLLGEQDAESGGWGQYRGDDANSLNTAEAVLAILDADSGVDPGHKQMVKAREFLLSAQCHATPNAGAWTRTVDKGASEVPDVLRTALVLQALIRLGVSSTDTSVEAAVLWLEGRRANDGGWGASGEGSSNILLTCNAILALTAVAAARGETRGSERPIYNRLVVPAQRFLAVSKANSDGSYGPEGSLLAAHTLLVIMALQRLRRCAFEVAADAEEAALRWVIDNADRCLDLVEEEVALDPARPSNNYDFLYMTDAMLAEVLFGAETLPDGGDALASAALLRLKTRQDGRGGFYGNRVFSWSTARCLEALRQAERHRSAFPTITATPQMAGRRSSVIIIVMAVLLSAVASTLAFTGRFTTGFGLFCLIVLLILMVTLRVISERTFARVAGLGINSGGKVP